MRRATSSSSGPRCRPTISASARAVPPVAKAACGIGGARAANSGSTSPRARSIAAVVGGSLGQGAAGEAQGAEVDRAGPRRAFVARADNELCRAAAHVADRDDLREIVHARERAAIRERRLLLCTEHADGDAASSLERLDQVVRVRRLPARRRDDDRDPRAAQPAGRRRVVPYHAPRGDDVPGRDLSAVLDVLAETELDPIGLHGRETVRSDVGDEQPKSVRSDIHYPDAHACHCDRAPGR